MERLTGIDRCGDGDIADEASGTVGNGQPDIKELVLAPGMAGKAGEGLVEGACAVDAGGEGEMAAGLNGLVGSDQPEIKELAIQFLMAGKAAGDGDVPATREKGSGGI